MKFVHRDLDRKRFSGEDMARFARYLTNSSRYHSLEQLCYWFDGPLESGRDRTMWTSRRFKL